ncbi:hypothetical protein AB0G74_29730 [Streptomyces sp. NPDC020875]|uniref:hypothetical protein n=1 Tax=Streptomyces sp. NPDC020875 TaxID=3154898 RepID=UPI0033FF6A6C
MTGWRDQPLGPVGEPDENPDAEAELRVLLARTVPSLPTPLNRMAQVRDRVRRHRRRRRAVVAAATTAALTAAVLALGGSVLSGSGLGAGTDDDTGGVAASPAQPGAPESRVAPARQVINPELAGLTLEFPAGWHTTNVSKDPATYVDGGTFAMNGPLSAPEKSCRLELCLPVQRLPADEMVVSFTDYLHQALPEEVKRDGTPLRAEKEISPECRAIGGTHEYEGEIGGAPGLYLHVYVNVCAGPDAPAARLAEISEVMETATFAAPAPGPGSGSVAGGYVGAGGSH